jgi:hypothetical protein
MNGATVRRLKQNRAAHMNRKRDTNKPARQHEGLGLVQQARLLQGRPT